MKKFVALALFAVMVLMMIPAANAAYGAPAMFVAKNYYDNNGINLATKPIQQYIDDAAESAIAADKVGSVYGAERYPEELTKSYASKYDAVGKAYYYVVIPVPTNLISGIYDFKSVKLNGKDLKIGNFIEGTEMTGGIAYYVVGYADVANGFSKTYTWTADDGNGNVATTTYTVKLTIKEHAAPLSALKYNFTGKGDGYSISTVNGVVFVDIAPAYLKWGVQDMGGMKATATFTVDGKNPIPDNEFGYLTINLFDVNEDGKYINKFGSQFKNTDTIKVDTMDLEAILNYYYGGSSTDALADGWKLDDTRMNIAMETSKGTYEAKNIKVVYRWVEVGDPKGIVIKEGASMTVELGEVFTLSAEGKEATLMESVSWSTTDGGKGILLQTGANEFQAIEEGVQYVMANYTYDHQVYTDTIKIIVADEPATTAYYVVCRALNVRKGPSTSYGKVGLVYRNDIVDVISVDNGWAKIWFEGAERYVSYKYIDQK